MSIYCVKVTVLRTLPALPNLLLTIRSRYCYLPNLQVRKLSLGKIKELFPLSNDRYTLAGSSV